MHLTHVSKRSSSEDIDFIRQFPLATLITSYRNRPYASQMPFLVDINGDAVVLVSYLDKSNKQWKHLEFEEALVIFQAPCTTIRKDDKDSKPEQSELSVKSIQLFGNCNIVNGKDAAGNLFKQVIEMFDTDLLASWGNASAEERESMLDQIVVFEMKIDDVQTYQTQFRTPSADESPSN